MEMEIFGLEIIALYLWLKKQEEDLDPGLLPLLNRLEGNVYGAFSIEELEELTEIYENKIDLLKEKGYS